MVWVDGCDASEASGGDDIGEVYGGGFARPVGAIMRYC
jgi:hypothetical protein